MPVDNAFVPADEAFIVLFPASGHYIFLPLVVTSSVTAGVPFISCSTSLDVTADVEIEVGTLHVADFFTYVTDVPTFNLSLYTRSSTVRKPPCGIW